MYLFFLIPLTITLVAGYIFKNSAADIAELMILATVFSLILSLVLAPWQLQLLVLILVLISTRRVLPPRDYRNELEENNDMRMF
jgi:hypothetical protein